MSWAYRLMSPVVRGGYDHPLPEPCDRLLVSRGSCSAILFHAGKGGLCSLRGDRSKLVALEMAFTDETRRNLLEPLLMEFQDNPILTAAGWSNALSRKGFDVIRDTVAGSRRLRAGDSTMAARASEYGTTLCVEFHYIVAKKPE